MHYKIGDVINVVPDRGYIDFEGILLLTGIIEFRKAEEVQRDFVDWWFGGKDKNYDECFAENQNLYVGVYLADSSVAKKGTIIAFQEEVIDIKRTEIYQKVPYIDSKLKS